MKLTTRDLTMVGLFAALHIAAAVSLRLGGEAAVPFSLVPFFVVLAGLLLRRQGALSLLVYTLLGVLGVPVFAKPPFAGLSYVLQPSFGFVIGYILAAYVIGALVEWRRWRSPFQLFLASLAGLMVLYAVGLPYLYIVLRYLLDKTLSLPQLLVVGMLPFVGFDLLKAGLASCLAATVLRRLQR
ncbi:MAG: biotin transporter BioY [Bacillota bacterium]|jgi:biotin transport system substrate-specific component